MRDFAAFCTLLACLVVFVASMIALVKPLPKLKMGTRKRALGGLGIALALFVVTGLVIPAPKSGATSSATAADENSGAGTVKASDAQIASVDAYESTKFASVKVDLKQGWSADDLPVQAAMVVEAAGKAIKAGARDIPADVETVAFWFTAPTVDLYGKESRSKVLQFRVKTADMKQVEYGKIPPQGMLEFADDVEVKLAARDGINDFCAENERSNALFCGRVAR